MTNRIILGHGRGSVGFWVSKPGWDVLTCPDEQLLFGMGGRMSQILTTGVLYFGANSAGVQLSAPLAGTNGYIPMVNVTGLIKVATGTQSTNVMSYGGGAGGVTNTTNYSAYIYVDSANIYINMRDNIPYTTAFYFTAFVDRANG